MTANPFIALFTDPVGVLAAIGYAFLMVALVVWTLAAIANLADRAWKHVVWISESWEFRNTDARYGDRWDWYLPPREVANRVTMLGLHVGAAAFLLALDAWAIGAAVWVLGNL